MLAERGWSHVGRSAFDLERFPCIEGAKDLAGGVLKAIRTRLSPIPVSLSVYPEGLQRYAKSLDSHGFFPSTLVPQESGTTVSPDGDFFIDWDKRVIGSR